ncbi:MAG: NAD-dependent epimerase/dehydratase family protein [Roseiflexaceae bacterium]|nr:NAD-dependent epimerase/dehydratase family protein [Roseiflexaceae bacterium]
MTTENLHVVFGVGSVGLAVMRELLKRGRRVRMVSRSGNITVPDGVELIKADATDPRSAAAACADAQVVYQCAQPGYTEWIEKFPPIQAGVLSGAAAVGATLVVADNLYMYGSVHGPITEDLPYNATTRKGRLRAQMANQILEAHRNGSIKATIGRASNFYGPEAGAQGWFNDRVVPPLLAGKTVSLLGNIDLPHTFSYVEDFGTALVILGEHAAALGQAWHIPNAPTRTPRQVLTAFFEEAGKRPKIGTTPDLAVRALGLINPMIREVAEMLYEFNEPFIVDHSKFERAFGNCATPEREAIRRTLAWYAQQAPVLAH